MIVTCIENTCNERNLLLPIHADERIENDNFVVVMGYTVSGQITEYTLKKGKSYTVYGILVYDEQVRFLVEDDNGRPFFCPEYLFVLKDAQVYWDWSVSSCSIADKSLVIVGYPELKSKEDYGNLIDLIKKNKNGMHSFLQYKDYYESYNLFG